MIEEPWPFKGIIHWWKQLNSEIQNCSRTLPMNPKRWKHLKSLQHVKSLTINHYNIHNYSIVTTPTTHIFITTNKLHNFHKNSDSARSRFESCAPNIVESLKEESDSTIWRRDQLNAGVNSTPRRFSTTLEVLHTLNYVCNGIIIVCSYILVVF